MLDSVNICVLMNDVFMFVNQIRKVFPGGACTLPHPAARFSSLLETNPMFPERPVNIHTNLPPETPKGKQNSEPDVYGRYSLCVSLGLII